MTSGRRKTYVEKFDLVRDLDIKKCRNMASFGAYNFDVNTTTQNCKLGPGRCVKMYMYNRDEYKLQTRSKHSKAKAPTGHRDMTEHTTMLSVQSSQHIKATKTALNLQHNDKTAKA